MPQGNPAGYAQPQGQGLNTMKRFSQMEQGAQAPQAPQAQGPDPGKASVLRGLAEALGLMGPPQPMPGVPRRNADVQLEADPRNSTAELIRRSQALMGGGGQ
jgi:hypothetical protein